MAALYWFALVVGGGVLAASFLGDLSDGGADGEMGETHAFKIVSLRTISYFLFGFGATGIALRLLGPLPDLLIASIAVAVGVAASGAAAMLLGYAGRTASGEHQGDDSFVGCAGRVILPFAAERPGRVVVRRGAREYELRARPFDGTAQAAAIGVDVVVVEMVGGTAYVSLLDQSPLRPLIAPLGESPPLRDADA